MTVEHSFFEHNTAVSVAQWPRQVRVVDYVFVATCSPEVGTFMCKMQRLTLRF